jgi:hypothetical protein
MKKGIVAAIAVSLLGAGVSATAAYVSGDVGQVTRLRTYSTFGNGDVLVWVQTPPSGCEGFWFRTTEQNGKEMMAQMLAAQQGGSAMYFTGHTDQLWPGSTTGAFCKLYSVDSLPN